MKAFVASAAVAVCVIGVSVSAAVQKHAIDIKTADGVILKGNYFSPERPGPAMLLLHACNMDRRSWEGLANDLAEGGIHVLMFDYRGYGESGGERITEAPKRRMVMADTWPQDVEAAYAFLLSQNGVDKSRIAAGGASCGALQAGEVARRHREVRTLMLLSWYVTDAARAYIASTPTLAVFGAAAEDDTTGPESPKLVANNSVAKHVNDVLRSSKHAQSVVRIYPGAEHGTPMFARNPELQPMIVSWLRNQLRADEGTR